MRSNFWKLSSVLVIGLAMSVSCQSNAQRQEMNSEGPRSQERGNDREPPTAAQVLEMMDANQDGRVSNAEARGRLKKDFSRIDSDNDGFLTTEELNNIPRRGRQEGQGERQGPPQRN